MLRTLTLSQAAWKVEQVMAETFPNHPYLVAAIAMATVGKVKRHLWGETCTI